jgi:5-methylcytosine-specific restriction enzyme subunit McrC
VPPRAIPIENVYYLLCYAWDVLEEADLADVTVTPEMRLQELLGSVLCSGLTHLLKRGLDRSYVINQDEIAGIKGKLDLGMSIKRTTFARARAHCLFDELSSDVMHNRILKTTLRRLASVADLDATIADRLRDLYRRMPGVRETRITAQSFRRVGLGRNNAYYGFLLDVCQIVHRNLLVDEAAGTVEFRDFMRDDAQMARLFEKFLYHFFAKEQRRFVVSAPRFGWRATGDEDDLAYLPEMRTDIVLNDGRQTIVIDAKYYSAALGEHFTKNSLHSTNLYQIFTYMSHLTPEDERSHVGGILLYPRTTETLRVRVSLFDHPFVAATLNLAQPWAQIRHDLLTMLSI